MRNKRTIRYSNKEKYKQCIDLRKQNLSYSEIRQIVPVAKSTLQNWLTLAGLTLTKEHLEIQLRKRVEKREAATLASKCTRDARRARILDLALDEYAQYFSNSLFLSGVMLYEAEGSKADECRFSNSDYRLILLFTAFLKQFFHLQVGKHIKFSLFIHETRAIDLEVIRKFWMNKLSVSAQSFKIYWKHNTVVRTRDNTDYVGQIQIRVTGVSYLTRKLLLFSDIIMKRMLEST